MSLIRNKKHKQLFAAFESSLIQLKLQRKTSRIAMKPIPDNMPVNLLNATTEERQLFLDSFDYVLTDCDGTVLQDLFIYNGCANNGFLITLIPGTVWDVDGPLEGASAAIDLLQQCGKRVVFVTNNTTRSREGYDQRFKKFQFDANFVSFLHVTYVYLCFCYLIYIVGKQRYAPRPSRDRIPAVD